MKRRGRESAPPGRKRNTVRHRYQPASSTLTLTVHLPRSLNTHYLPPSSSSPHAFCCHYHQHEGSTQWSFLSLPFLFPRTAAIAAWGKAHRLVERSIRLIFREVVTSHKVGDTLFF